MTIQFSVGLNHTVKGKCSPDKLSYVGAFVPTEVTIADLSTHISKGHPWMPGLIDDGQSRKQESCNKAWCLALDIDNTDTLKDDNEKTVKDAEGKALKVYREELTIAQALENPYLSEHCCLIQPSASHKLEWDKFRLVFLLPEAIENHALIRICNRYLAHVTGVGDPACKDASRFFFGAPGSVPALLQEVRLPDSFVTDALEWDTAVTAKLEAEAAAKREYTQSLGQDSKDQISQVRSALSYIAPHTPGAGRYPDLIVMCAGVVNDLGFEGENLLIEWDGFGRDTEKKVRGLSKTANKTATLGSLFYLAKQEGYRYPKREYTPEEKRAYAELKRKEQDMATAAKMMSNPASKAIDLAESTAVEPPKAFTETEEYKESLSDFEVSEQKLKGLSESRFSPMPEEYWLGSGAIHQACGQRVRPTIRNGWMAQSIVIGQLLATLTPVHARIVPCDSDVVPQPILAWMLIQAAKNSGKTVIFLACAAIEKAFKAIGESRKKDVSKLLKEIDKARGDEEGPDLSDEDLATNRHLNNVELRLHLGNFTQASLRDALAVVTYWPKLSQDAARLGIGTTRIPAKNLLIYSREAVAMLEDLSAHNQSATGFKSFLAGAWSAEMVEEAKRTGNISVNPDDVGLGMLIAAQDGTLSGIMQTEIRRKAGQVDTGFGLRFAPCVLENTASGNLHKEFKARSEDDRDSLPLDDLQGTMTQFMANIQQFTRIHCDEGATAYYSDVWYQWMNERLAHWNSAEWSRGIESKLSANVFRIAWMFRCIELFDAVALGQTLEPVITKTAMERAIEYMQRSEACFMFELEHIARQQDHYERSKESEKQQSILKSKYYTIFTNPDMTHQWIQDQKNKGANSIRKLTQKVNGPTRAALAATGLNVTEIVTTAWERAESRHESATPIDPQAEETESYEDAFEYKPESDG